MKKLISIVLSALIVMSVACVNITFKAVAEENEIGNTGLTYYVDADNGNDKNDGLTPETAWKTLDKVNKTTFEPGSAILLKRGCVWKDTFLWPKGTGDKENVNYVSCYGDEDLALPYIASLYDDSLDGLPNYDTCLYLDTNQNYWDISNLSLYNGTNGTGTQTVVKFYSDNNSNRMIGNYLHDCIINGSNPSNWKINSRSGLSGISIEGWIDGVTIENNEVSNVKTNGIGVNGWNAGCNYKGEINKNAAKGVVIRGNVLYNIGKDGILPNNCNQPLVEYNVCGKAHSYATNTAHVAMWPFASYGSLFQYNEAYDTKTIYDGQGFDCDYQCYYTTFQYNYSHDNVGGFMLICTEATNWDGGYSYNKGSTVRYNISQGDMHYIFNLTDAIEDTRIYNNTIYASRNSYNNATHLFFSYDKGKNTLSGRSLPHNTLVANNIFWLDSMAGVDLTRNTETVFKNNLIAGRNWQSSGPSNGTVTTNDAGEYLYREVSGNIRGKDPLFIDGGRASMGRESCGVYKLYEGSPALGAGYYIEDGFHECPTDFFGNPIDKNNVNIGAYQGKGEVRPQYIYDEKYHKMLDFEGDVVGEKGVGSINVKMSGIHQMRSVKNTDTAFVDITDLPNAINPKTKSTKALRFVNNGDSETEVSATFYVMYGDLQQANGLRIFFNPNGASQNFTVSMKVSSGTTYSKTVTVKNPEYRVFTFNEKYSGSNNQRVTPEIMRYITELTIKTKLQESQEVYVDDIQVNNGEMDEIETSEKFYNEKADVTVVADFEDTKVGGNTNYANCWSGPKSSPAGGSEICPNGTKAIFLTNGASNSTSYSGGFSYSTAFNSLKSALANDTDAEGIQFELITRATINGVELTEEQKYLANDKYNKYKLTINGAKLTYTTVGGATKEVSSFTNGDTKLQTDPNNLCRIPFSDLYTTYTEDGVTYKVYLTDFSVEDQQTWKSKISNIGLSCSTYGGSLVGGHVIQYIFLDNLAIYKNVQHEAGDWTVISMPSCVRDGVQYKYCEHCNRIMETKTEESTGHKYGEWYVSKPATCEETGQKEVKCTVCEKVIEARIIEALQHNYVPTTIKPTCLEEGYDCEKCSICKDEINKSNIVPATGHTKTKWVIDTPATCTEEGSSHEECEICGETLQTAVEEKGHRFINTYVAPTCEEDGYVLHKCKICEFSYVSDEEVSAGHTVVTDEAVEPDCENTGLTEGSHCSVCGEIFALQETVDALGHEFENYKSNNDETCSKNGTETAKCENCDKTDTREIVNSAKSHTEIVDRGYAATCDKTGLTNGKHCSVCGEVTLKQEIIEKLPHTIGSWETVKQATETQEGEKVKKCLVCGEIMQTETLPKLEPTVKPDELEKPTVCVHITVIKNAKNATYFGAGYSGDTVCIKCNETITKGVVTAQLKLAKPTFTAKLVGKKIKVIYKKTADVNKIQIRYRIKGKWKIKDVNAKKNTVTKTLKKLKKGKYKVQIRTMVVSGSQKVYSKWSKAQKVKIK